MHSFFIKRKLWQKNGLEFEKKRRKWGGKEVEASKESVGVKGKVIEKRDVS